MPRDTPLEDYYVECISPKIREFLRKKRFNVIPRPISRQDEKHTPYDRLYDLGFKIFGLQFKPPKLDEGQVYWERTEAQHHTLKKFNWIFYALPYFYEDEDYDNGLYLTRILESNRFSDRRLYYKKNKGMDWGTFITEVLKCRLGLRTREPSNISFFPKPGKRQESVESFLKIIDKFRVDPSVEKIKREADHSFIEIALLNIQNKEVEIYSYYYPNYVLKNLEKT